VYAAPALDGLNQLAYASDDHLVYWRNRYGNTVTFQTGNAVQSSPTLANGYIYVGSNDGRLYCLSGQYYNAVSPVWTYTASSAVQSSPAVSPSGTVVAASTDGHVFALNALTGSPVWNATLGGHVTASPTLDSTTVYIGCSDRNMYALSLLTGAVVWKYQTGAAISSTAALRGDGVLVFGSSDNTVYALNSFGGK
jgi:outer membrane protein assembly factor BamB